MKSKDDSLKTFKFIKNKEKNISITSIENEKREITSDILKRTIQKYYEQSHANNSGNLDDMDKFL